MFKTDIINELAARTGNTKIASELFLDSFIDIVLESLKKDKDVTLIGFGSFKVVPTKARVLKNPKTKKEIKVPAGKKVKFTIGKTLKDTVKK